MIRRILVLLQKYNAMNSAVSLFLGCALAKAMRLQPRKLVCRFPRSMGVIESAERASKVRGNSKEYDLLH